MDDENVTEIQGEHRHRKNCTEPGRNFPHFSVSLIFVIFSHWVVGHHLVSLYIFDQFGTLERCQHHCLLFHVSVYLILGQSF